MISGSSKRLVVLERTFKASLANVWKLWTTKEGIESWWGPDGFSTEVLTLELRPQGEMHYVMSAVSPEMIAFMQGAGMPVSTEGRITYREIIAQTRLAYVHLTDFIPGVTPYDVATLVEFSSDGPNVQMVLTFEALHDDTWTERARLGHESQLGKLEKVLEQMG